MIFITATYLPTSISEIKFFLFVKRRRLKTSDKIWFIVENYFLFIFQRKILIYRQYIYIWSTLKELMVASILAVSMTMFVKSSRVMPINTKCLLDTDCHGCKSYAERKSSQEELSTIDMSSNELSVSPGFISRRIQ